MDYSDLASRLEHINFVKVQGMSSPLGKVELLGDIFDKCASDMQAIMKKNEAEYKQVNNPKVIADTIGISAMMIQDISGKRIHDYPFDLERMTSSEGDTGPYIQHSHARLCSIIEKSGYKSEDLVGADFSLLQEKQAIGTLRILAQYPDVMLNAFKTLESTTVLTYLSKLTHQISSGYDDIGVIDIAEGPDVSNRALRISTAHVRS